MEPMNARGRPVFAMGLLLWGCSGGGGAATRFVAVNNALRAVGFSPHGQITAGSLPEHGSSRVRMQLDAGTCYTFVGIGGEGIVDLDLVVTDAQGREVAHDGAAEPGVAVRVCPESSGGYTVRLTAASGGGEYYVSAWTGGAGTQTAGRPGPTGLGTCQGPIPITTGQPISGDTRNAQNSLSGSCAAGEASEVVYSLTVERRTSVSMRLEASYDAALYVQQQCGRADSEVGCNDDERDSTHSRLDLSLDPGTYYVVVDGYDDNRGTYTLVVTTTEAPPTARVCADAAVIAAGQPTTGTTAGMSDTFQATCAAGARSPDRAYRFEVPAASRIRFLQETPSYDGALYVRRECANAATELACNDDWTDSRHSLLLMTLDPGSYYLYSDGYGNNAAGPYTITMDMAPAAGGGAAGDACADAVAMTGAGAFTGDTLTARDDLQGSCAPTQGGPDVVFRLDVTRRSRARLSLEQSEITGGIVYVQRRCGDRASEVACGRGSLDTVLAPGSHFIVVDSAAPDAFGRFRLNAQLEDVAALERSCQRARVIQPGHAITGATQTGGPDQFQASCGANARAPDAVYQLRLVRRSRVRLLLSASYDGVLYLRRGCTDRSTEIACNDDDTDAQHSRIETTLDAGTYFVFVDGYNERDAGNYTLDVTVSNP